MRQVGESARPPGLDVLSEQECRELLTRHSLGRITFTIGDQPEIFPVNYSADGSVIVFRTAQFTRLQDAVKRRVAFEIDDWDPETGIGWSVVVKGVAEEITKGLDPFAAALRTRPVVPLAPGRREYWIAVYASEISGRRFRQP